MSARELVERLSDEADLCRNEGAHDLAALLDEARVALTPPAVDAPQPATGEAEEAARWHDKCVKRQRDLAALWSDEPALAAYYSKSADKHEATAAALRRVGVGSCAWFEDDDGLWASGCGHDWSFPEGGPAENGVKFCMGCGKPVAATALSQRREGA